MEPSVSTARVNLHTKPLSIDRLDAEGRIYWPKKEGGWPRYVRYLDEMQGVHLQDVWTDLAPINAKAQERLGYPTQKPEMLLERVICSSSNEGEVILDPFCGCGTAIAVAHRKKRRWLWIDITQAAMGVVKRRLLDLDPDIKYEVAREPVSVPDAKALAEESPYQFQWWALNLVGARVTERKKGADRGIDGKLIFRDSENSYKEVILSVKAGHLLAQHVRELRGVIERDGAEIGVLISMNRPTSQMKLEAAAAGFYSPPWGKRKYPRLQLLTIADLLDGRQIEMPEQEGANVTLRKGPKAESNRPTQGKLFGGR